MPHLVWDRTMTLTIPGSQSMCCLPRRMRSTPPIQGCWSSRSPSWRLRCPRGETTLRPRSCGTMSTCWTRCAAPLAAPGPGTHGGARIPAARRWRRLQSKACAPVLVRTRCPGSPQTWWRCPMIATSRTSVRSSMRTLTMCPQSRSGGPMIHTKRKLVRSTMRTSTVSPRSQFGQLRTLMRTQRLTWTLLGQRNPAWPSRRRCPRTAWEVQTDLARASPAPPSQA
mmetsp:Transcript_47604/g.151940  ORF Transcript_47604/g.151940 Transcript_47604/m.151940 type:complete len:225 (-) Transcript_47604:233-907(-)